MSLAKKLLQSISEHILRDSAASVSDGGDTMALQVALNKFLIPKGVVTNELKLAVGAKEGAEIGGVVITNPIFVYVGYLGTAQLVHDAWKVDSYDSVLATDAVHISTSLDDCKGAVQDRLDQVNFNHVNNPDSHNDPKTRHFGTIVEVIETFKDGIISDQSIGKRFRVTSNGSITDDMDAIGDVD